MKQKTRKLAEAYMGGLITRKEYYLIQQRRDKKKAKRKAKKERANRPMFTGEHAKEFLEFMSLMPDPNPNVFRHYEKGVINKSEAETPTVDSTKQKEDAQPAFSTDYFLRPQAFGVPSPDNGV